MRPRIGRRNAKDSKPSWLSLKLLELLASVIPASPVKKVVVLLLPVAPLSLPAPPPLLRPSVPPLLPLFHPWAERRNVLPPRPTTRMRTKSWRKRRNVTDAEKRKRKKRGNDERRKKKKSAVKKKRKKRSGGVEGGDRENGEKGARKKKMRLRSFKENGNVIASEKRKRKNAS